MRALNICLRPAETALGLRHQERFMNRLASAAYLILFCASPLLAESKNPADYPLRFHIFSRNETTFYHNRSAEEAKGEGRGDLYEGGEAKGVDFSFECSDKLKASFGFETYPAKWHKPGKEITVLLPVFGKTGSYFTCNFKTDVKDFAYYQNNGRLLSEPVGEFKTWMVKHDYDPEHGKNMPVKLQPGSRPDSAAPAPPQ
jgi:hypothetical protein